MVHKSVLLSYLENHYKDSSYLNDFVLKPHIVDLVDHHYSFDQYLSAGLYQTVLMLFLVLPINSKGLSNSILLSMIEEELRFGQKKS